MKKVMTKQKPVQILHKIFLLFAGNISVTRVHETGVIPTDDIKMVLRKSTNTIQEVIDSEFFQ